MMIQLLGEVNRAFSAGGFGFHESWGAAPRLEVNAAPLALNMCLTLALLMLMRSSSPSSLKKFEIRIPKSEIKLKRHI